ncbi:transposase [Massilia sp. RP-1-19]|uniref:Transposase n=1 Tax=Massilia polaris TaxID=2728846 RepID=A0A848HSM7_9BURK|nr:transposase [Massilia polaris]
MDIHILAPKAGEDYPTDWNEFLTWFASEEACLSYLERLRWPAGFVCPACSCIDQPYRSSRGRMVCRDCGHQCTVVIPATKRPCCMACARYRWPWRWRVRFWSRKRTSTFPTQPPG